MCFRKMVKSFIILMLCTIPTCSKRVVEQEQIEKVHIQVERSRGPGPSPSPGPDPGDHGDLEVIGREHGAGVKNALATVEAWVEANPSEVRAMLKSHGASTKEVTDILKEIEASPKQAAKLLTKALHQDVEALSHLKTNLKTISKDCKKPEDCDGDCGGHKHVCDGGICGCAENEPATKSSNTTELEESEDSEESEDVDPADFIHPGEDFVNKWVASFALPDGAGSDASQHHGISIAESQSFMQNISYQMELYSKEWGLLDTAFTAVTSEGNRFGSSVKSLNLCDWTQRGIDWAKAKAAKAKRVAAELAAKAKAAAAELARKAKAAAEAAAKKAYELAKKTLMAAAKAAMTAAKFAWEQLMKVKKMWAGMLSLISKGFGLIKDIVKFIGRLIMQVGSILKTLVKEGVYSVMEAPSWDSLKGMVRKTHNRGNGGGFLALDDIMKDLKDFVSNFLSKTGDMLSTVWDFVTGIVDKLANSGPAKFLLKAFASLGGVIGQVAGFFKSLIGLGVGSGVTSLKGGTRSTSSKLTSVADYFLKAIDEVKHKINNPIMSDHPNPLIALLHFILHNTANLAQWFSKHWTGPVSMKSQFKSLYSVWNKIRGLIDGKYGAAPPASSSLIEEHMELSGNSTPPISSPRAKHVRADIAHKSTAGKWNVKKIIDLMQTKFSGAEGSMGGGVMRSVMGGLDKDIGSKRSALVNLFTSFGPQLKKFGINLGGVMKEVGLDTNMFAHDRGHNFFSSLAEDEVLNVTSADVDLLTMENTLMDLENPFC